MTSTDQQRSQRKRTARKVFTPSESDRYALLHYEEDGQHVIVKYSEIQSEQDGEVELRNGDTATLLFAGSHTDCRGQMKTTNGPKRTRTFDDSDDESDVEDNIDGPSFDKQAASAVSFIQRPRQGYQTPAARRRETLTTNRISSPINPRHISHGRTNVRHHPFGKAVSSNRQEQTTDRSNNPGLLDEDECVMMDTESPLVRLQSAAESQTSLIRSLKDEVAKLTKRMGRFSSALSSKNEQLALYQDPNDKENYQDEIEYNGENLLNISGRDPGDFARKVLRRLFTSNELATSVLPSRYDHLYLKKPLDKERFELLNNVIRINYRISKNNYASFYTKIIQKTLSDCIYNEGTRKKSKLNMDHDQSRAQSDSTIARATVEAPSSTN